jgi:hypothetical protein
LDRRGAIAVAALDSGLFSDYNVLVNEVIAQHDECEFQIGLRRSGIIWRDESRLNPLLEFALSQLQQSRARVDSLEFWLKYLHPEDDSFEGMIGEMAALMAGWRRMGLAVGEINDVGFMLDVAIDGAPVYAEIGPMETWQLKARIYGDKAAPKGALPERAWYLAFNDQEPYLITGLNQTELREVITNRLGGWHEFAKRCFKE